ncbi:unnamed protein product, partial [Nesidiocoris tenuis]
MFDCVYPTRTAVSYISRTKPKNISEPQKNKKSLKSRQNYQIRRYDHGFPRTPSLNFQRFGCGLVDTGQINLKHKKYAFDFTPIQDDCGCSTCKRYTKAYLHTIVTQETVACHLIT